MVLTAGLLSCFSLASISLSRVDDGFASTFNLINNANNTQRNKTATFLSHTSLSCLLSISLLTHKRHLQLIYAYLSSININDSFIEVFIIKLVLLYFYTSSPFNSVLFIYYHSYIYLLSFMKKKKLLPLFLSCLYFVLFISFIFKV